MAVFIRRGGLLPGAHRRSGLMGPERSDSLRWFAARMWNLILAASKISTAMFPRAREGTDTCQF